MVDDVDSRIEAAWNSEQIAGDDRIWAALAYRRAQMADGLVAPPTSG